MEQNVLNEEVKQESKAKKVLSIILNVIFYAFIILLFFFALSNIRSKNTNIPNIFGYGYLTVNSNSMKSDTHPESFSKGDVILVKILNEKNAEKNIKLGDIVTFYDITLQATLTDMGVTEGDTTYLNTHRIVDIYEKDGRTYYVAQGDYVEASFPGDVYVDDDTTNPDHTGNKIQTFTADKVRGKWVKNFGAGTTKALNFLHTSTGFGICVVLPTAILLIFEVVVLVLNIMKMNKEKMKQEMAVQAEKQAVDMEEEKRRMREELMAELRKEQEAASQQQASTEEDKTE